MSLIFRNFVFEMSEYPKFEEGDFYLNEQGYKVMTEQYHLKRGYCCQNGCKHCPYGFKEKQRQQAIEQAKKLK